MLYILIAILFNIQNEVSYKQLTFADFKLKKQTDNTVAESSTSIGYNYDGYKTVTVFCQFNKAESYITHKGMTPYILHHEQKHFDITYIYANKLISELQKQQVLTIEIVESIYEKILSEKDKVQSQYDNETNYSENKELQAVWDLKIDKLLR